MILHSLKGIRDLEWWFEYVCRLYSPPTGLANLAGFEPLVIGNSNNFAAQQRLFESSVAATSI